MALAIMQAMHDIEGTGVQTGFGFIGGMSLDKCQTLIENSVCVV